MTHASLCSGIGAAELAAEWMGWGNAFWCENDPFCRKVLKYWFNESKGYGDIKKTDFKEWRGRIDVLTAGFPCQPFSNAGKRKGTADDRYLWPEVIRVVREVRPAWFIGENVNGIVSMVQSGRKIRVESGKNIFREDYRKVVFRRRYILSTILEDIESAGYTVRTVVIPACAVGAPHRRNRIFIIAYADSDRSNQSSDSRHREKKIRQSTSRKFKFAGLGGERIAADADKLNGNISGFCTGEIPHPEASGIWDNSSAATSGRRVQDNESKPAGQPEQNIPDWRDFPTQSPVCGRNDGISGKLDGIAFSRWRRESIKAFGNAIVPQVIYEIFKGIEKISN